MTYWRRRLCAGLVMVGLIAPSWAAAAVTLHVFLQHNHLPDVDTVSLDALLHGHRHSAGASDHEHTFFAPLAQAKPGMDAASFVLLQRSGISSELAPPLNASVRALAGSAFASGAGPPRGISPLRI